MMAYEILSLSLNTVAQKIAESHQKVESEHTSANKFMRQMQLDAYTCIEQTKKKKQKEENKILCAVYDAVYQGPFIE